MPPAGRGAGGRPASITASRRRSRSLLLLALSGVRSPTKPRYCRSTTTSTSSEKRSISCQPARSCLRSSSPSRFRSVGNTRPVHSLTTLVGTAHSGRSPTPAVERRPRHRAPGGGAHGSSSTGDRAPASGGAARSARPSSSARGTWGRRARPRRTCAPGAPPTGGIRRPAAFGRARRSLRPAPPWAAHRCDLGPPRAGRREHARAAHGVEAWRRHAGGQAAQQRQRVHVHRDRPVGVRLLQGDAHQAVSAPPPGEKRPPAWPRAR